jgi:hypothetical protein
LDDEPDRLESWKEIAAFIGRDERTAMRWAARGMPVHHGPGGKHARVFASRKEISRWLAKQTDGRSESESKHPPERPRRWKWIVGAGLCVFVLLLSAGFVFWHRVRKTPAPQVTRVTFTYDAVVAWNGSQQLWKYELAHPLATNAFDIDRPIDRFVRIVQLPSAGKTVVILVAPFRTEPDPNSIIEMPVDCFSNGGKLLWSYVAHERLRFGANELQGPWNVTALFLSYDNGRPELWVAESHFRWGNSLVEEIDPTTGRTKLRFVNTGVLYALNEVKTGRGTYLLAGGFNNEYSAGALAVINEDKPFAASPQTPGTRHYCVSCPPGVPDEYFVFPRTEVNRAEEIYEDPVGGIFISEDRAEIIKIEAEGKAKAGTIYEFRTAPSIWPVSLRYDSWYDMLYRRLEEERRIHFSLADSPERLHPQPIDVWTPSHGWERCNFKPPGIASARAVPISKAPHYVLAAAR